MTIHSIVTGDMSGGVITIDGSSTWKSNPIAAGDTFQISSGTYAGRLVIDNMPGASGNEITFTNSGGVAEFTGSSDNSIRVRDNNNYVIFDGSGHSGTTYGIKTSGKEIGVIDRWSNITFRYIEIANSLGIGLHTFQFNYVTTAVTGLLVENCWIHDSPEEGMYIGNNNATATDYVLTDVTVRNCLFEDNTECIDMNGNSGAFAFRDNTFLRTTPGTATAYQAVIAISDSGQTGINGYIERNWLKDCDGFGINLPEKDGSSSDTIWIQNNVLINMGTHATSGKNDAMRGSGSGATLRYVNNTVRNTGNGTTGRGIRLVQSYHYAQNNLVFESDSADFSEAAAASGNSTFNISSDTTGGDSTTRTTVSLALSDVSTDDYRLTASSPAVDAGSSSNAPSDDYLQNSRDATPDAGAYEYLSGSSSIMVLTTGGLHGGTSPSTAGGLG